MYANSSSCNTVVPPIAIPKEFIFIIWFNLLHNLKCQIFCTGILLFVPSGIKSSVILSNLNLWSNGYCSIVELSPQGISLKLYFLPGGSKRKFYFSI